MIDCSRFVEVFSPVAFLNLEWPDDKLEVKAMFERQWSSLRQAILCIIRPQSKNLKKVIDSYQKHIGAYADATYEVWPAWPEIHAQVSVAGSS